MDKKTLKELNKYTDRDPVSGHFLPGNSAVKGYKVRVKELKKHRDIISAHMPALLKRAFDMTLNCPVKEARSEMMTLLFNVHYPRLRTNTPVTTEVEFDPADFETIEGCTKAIGKLIVMCGAGDISLEEKESYLMAISQNLRVLEITEIEKKIAALNKKVFNE